MKKIIYSFVLCFVIFAATSNVYGYSLWGTKWGNPTFGTGATITYSFMGAGVPVDDYITYELDELTVDPGSIFPSGWKSEIERAFDAWANVADLTFVEVADDGVAWNYGAVGDIRFGAHAFDGPLGILAHGFYPPPNGLFAAGDIHFDSAELWTLDFVGPGFSIFQVMAHELGHALGLGHEDFDTTGVRALMNPYYSEAFEGLLADDIAGIQAIYGAAKAEIPEPATLLLFAIGLVGLAARKRT